MFKSQVHHIDDNPEAANYSINERSKNVMKSKVFMVWQKSSMGFQGTDGFSVYDDAGQFIYRVDNSSRRPKCFTKEIVLMDGSGTALLCLRPRIMSMRDQWNAYGIEERCNKQRGAKLFSMRRHSMLQKADKAAVSVTKPITGTKKPKLVPGFRIEGCFEKKNCTIYSSEGDQEVARIQRKRAGVKTPVLLGNDVFALTVQPGFD